MTNQTTPIAEAGAGPARGRPSLAGLVDAELRRFFARRFVLAMIAFVLGVLALIAIGYAANTTPINDQVRAEARARAQAQIDDQIRANEQIYQECLANQNGGTPGKFGPGFDCEQLRAKDPTSIDIDLYTDSLLPRQFVFVREADGVLYLAAAILCLFAFVVGASFIGAEWTSGGLTNLLLWRPRRLPLLATKLGSGLLGVLAACTGILVAWLGTLWTIAAAAGSTAGATAGFWRSTALTSVRILALALIAAAIGFALASLGRHTAMALGVFIGYLLVFEVGTRIVFGQLQVAFPERFTLVPYVVGWLNKSLTLYDYDVCRFSFDQCEPREYVITMASSAWVIGLLTALLVGGAMFTFSRRDVA
ncbi:MAG: ABC transporter permease subunit [Micromonosporaceae bacterium]